jgi:hypothetical protein
LLPDSFAGYMGFHTRAELMFKKPLMTTGQKRKEAPKPADQLQVSSFMIR